MNPHSRHFKVEYAAELLRLATEDLKAARILMDGKAKPESTLYHAEQVVEKSIKAVLCFDRKPVPLTHDISSLLLLLDADQPPGGMSLSDLTPFATIRRYEEGSAIIEQTEVKLAIEACEKVLQWAINKTSGQKS